MRRPGSLAFPTAPRRWRRVGHDGRASAARCVTEGRRAPRSQPGRSLWAALSLDGRLTLGQEAS